MPNTLTQMASFRFISSRNLRKTLGHYDAAVEILELSIRCFEDDLANSENPSQHLFGLCERYGIQVNQFDKDTVRHRAGHFYVMSVYQQFEKYTRDLEREHPAKWDKKRDKESRPDWFIRGLPFPAEELDSDLPSKAQGMRQSLINYYRLIRNGFAHSSNTNKLEKRHSRLQEYADEIKNLYSTLPPNRPSEIGFEDFILFTKLAKDFADRVDLLARPSSSELAEMVIRLDDDPDSEVDIARLKRFANNEPRLRNSLSRLLKSQFATSGNDEANSVVDELIEGPLAQW